MDRKEALAEIKAAQRNNRRANLRGANLSGANLRNADLSGANLRDANLRDADLSYANLNGAYLSYANLNGAYLWNANLMGADLRDADLWGANLWNADLRGADLRDANLSGACLSYANLNGANLWNANLRGADLWGACLKDTNLKNASGVTKEMLGQSRKNNPKTEENNMTNKENKTAQYPHNIQTITKAEVNDCGMKRCSECPFGQEIPDMSGAYRCTTGISGSYSYNEGCSFLHMVKTEGKELQVSPHLELKFNEPTEEKDSPAEPR